jgi:hypothetical protein
MARRIELSSQTWHALDALSWEMERPLNDLAEEAFSDLLKKHHPPRFRPRSLREALREFARSRTVKTAPDAAEVIKEPKTAFMRSAVVLARLRMLGAQRN